MKASKEMKLALWEQRVVLFSRYLTDKGHKVGLIGSTRLISNYS